MIFSFGTNISTLCQKAIARCYGSALVHFHGWETGSQARASIGRWITFYNHHRPHTRATLIRTLQAYAPEVCLAGGREARKAWYSKRPKAGAPRRQGRAPLPPQAPASWPVEWALLYPQLLRAPIRETSRRATLRHTKGGEPRVIDLDPETVAMLYAMPRSNRWPYVFFNGGNEGWYQDVSTRFGEYGQNVELGARLHDLNLRICEAESAQRALSACAESAHCADSGHETG